MSGANISAEQESYNAIRTAVRNLQTHLQTLNAKVKAEVLVCLMSQIYLIAIQK